MCPGTLLEILLNHILYTVPTSSAYILGKSTVWNALTDTVCYAVEGAEASKCAVVLTFPYDTKTQSYHCYTANTISSKTLRVNILVVFPV